MRMLCWPFRSPLNGSRRFPRRSFQVGQFKRAPQDTELLERRPTDIRRDAPALAGLPQQPRIGVGEALDHYRMITRLVKNGKR